MDEGQMNASAELGSRSPDDDVIAAASVGDLEHVKAALAAGGSLAALSSESNTPLLAAALGNPRKGVSRFLVEQGADLLAVNEDKETALHGFARFGWCDLIEKALDAGCDINAQDSLDDTPLVLAASEGMLDVVQLLVKRGASPFRTLEDQSTVLSLCDVASLHAALDAGLFVDAATIKGATMLMHASEQDFWELSNALIARGANINAADRRGWTPLIHAALNGAPRCLAGLLGAGANTDHRTANGETLEHLLSGCKSEVRAVYRSWKARNAMQATFKPKDGMRFSE